MSEWRTVRLGELGEVNRGRSRHRPRDAAHLYGGSYPFIQTGDIKASGGRILKHSQTYSDAGLAQSRLWPKNTMVITIAANIAETALLGYPACFPDSVVGFIADQEKSDVRYVEYYFRMFRRKIQDEHVGTGSVQDNINLQILSELQLTIPSLSEQKAIAEVLGALDDKIELNRKMNATLEAMARALFKSWFVDFDPVRAKSEGREPFGMDAETAALFPSRLAPSALGDIPEGWGVARLGELADVNWGDTNTTKASYVEKGYPAFSASGQDGFLDHADYEHDGIVMSAIGANCGQTWFAKGKWSCIKNTIRLWSTSPDISNEYLFIATNDVHFWPKRGSAQPFISQTDARNCRIIKPANKLGMIYGNQTKALYGRIVQGDQESLWLAKLRDYLLPKLISGEIRIPDAEKMVGVA